MGEGSQMGDSDCSKGSSSECHCALCRVRPHKRKQEYCVQCSKEVEACQKDAKDNDWLEDFEFMKEHPETFTAMMREFQVQCPNRGRGRGHKRAQFNTDFLPTRLMKKPINSTPRSSADVSP